MFLNPIIRKKLLEKQALDTFIETNTIVPKHIEERITLQDTSNYVEEFKNIIIVDKGNKLSSEEINESSDEEIIEISEPVKEKVQEEIKEQEELIKEITIDEEALKPDTEEITIEEDKIEDDVSIDDDNSSEGVKEEMKGGSDIKKIVVHSFF